MTAKHAPKGDLSGVQGPSARANIYALLFLLYWLLSPYAFYPLIDSGSMSLFVYSATMLILRFLPPVLLYFLLTRKRPRTALSMAPLSLTNVLYIAVITTSVRVIEFLLEFGLPLVLRLEPPQMPSMGPIWVHLVVTALIAVICRELLIRGVLYSEYQSQGVSIQKTALVTGLFFGLTHTGLVGITASTLLGILWAYLLYYTRSIWAPALSHALYNALWQLHPAFRVDSQADFEAALPGFVGILAFAALLAIPALLICAKQFWAENQRPQEPCAKESKTFTRSYWALIAIMLLVIVLVLI